jgi:hypothetical protein
MDIFDYKLGIHPQCGEIISADNDIILTEFYTEEYCKVIVDFCKKHSNFFVKTGDAWDDPYSNYSLAYSGISPILFQEYVTHFQTMITPVVNKHFIWDKNIEGFFTPFINRFDMNSQADMALHCETSRISIVVKLNEDFGGGDLVFPRQNFRSSSMKVGQAVVFPGMVTHPHGVENLTWGERYTMVGFSYPPTWNATNSIPV